jgi:hypothetical protein
MWKKHLNGRKITLRSLPLETKGRLNGAATDKVSIGLRLISLIPSIVCTSRKTL